MSYFFINRNFWHKIIVFFMILLFVSSCVSTTQPQITVAPDILKQYVGSYKLVPNSQIIKVKLDNKGLTVQSRHQKDRLYARSETKFYQKLYPVEIQFFKNDKGEVTHLVVVQNGNTMIAKRIRTF